MTAVTSSLAIAGGFRACASPSAITSTSVPTARSSATTSCVPRPGTRCARRRAARSRSAATREEWERTADEHPELEARARRLDAVFGRRGRGGRLVRRRRRDARVLAQAGRARTASSSVTDYAPATVERLRPIFAEAECVVHDLVDRPSARRPTCTCSTGSTPSSTNRRWQEILARFAGRRSCSWRPGRSDLRGALAEVRRAAARGASRAGWVRTRPAVEALWEPTHTARPVDVGDLPAWELRAEDAILWRR